MPCHRGWHAGASEWEGVQGLNDCSIGIELVNYNGNVFPFTEAQYRSLQGDGQVQNTIPICVTLRGFGHEHMPAFGQSGPRCAV